MVPSGEPVLYGHFVTKLLNELPTEAEGLKLHMSDDAAAEAKVSRAWGPLYSVK